MRTLTKITGVLGVLVAMGGFSGRVAAAETTGIKQTISEPTHVFAQVGTGMVELGHGEVGAFLGPHLTIEAMATWSGVSAPTTAARSCTASGRRKAGAPRGTPCWWARA